MRFLKNILGLFTDNWGLKIIALLLAIVIYYGDKAETSHAQDKTTHDRPLFNQFR